MKGYEGKIKKHYEGNIDMKDRAPPPNIGSGT